MESSFHSSSICAVDWVKVFLNGILEDSLVWKGSSMRYVISDTHFGHDNIKIYEPTRQDYDDEHLVHLWNSIVKPEDEVLHLGDFAFKSYGWDMIKQLNGKVSLLKGNHDVKKENKALYTLGFTRIIDSIEIELPNRAKIMHMLSQRFLKETLQNVICLVQEIQGKRVLFSHYPPFYDDPYDTKQEVLQIKEILRVIFESTQCDICYHGHIHSKKSNDPRCINASIEHTAFKPVLLVQ